MPPPSFFFSLSLVFLCLPVSRFLFLSLSFSPSLFSLSRCFLSLCVSVFPFCCACLFSVLLCFCSLCLSAFSLFLSFASLVPLSLCFLCLCVLPACLLPGLPCLTQGGHNKTENKLFRVHILCIGRLRLHHATSIPFYFPPLPDYEEEKESSILIIFSKDHTSRWKVVILYRRHTKSWSF